MRQYHHRHDRGRVSYERNKVPVPREVRLALARIDLRAYWLARKIGVSEISCEALLSPCGFVSRGLLEKVKAKLEEVGT